MVYLYNQHRMMRVFTTFFSVSWAVSALNAGEPADGTKPVSYFNQIRPILQANCQGCHQPAKAKGGYVMTDFAGLFKGGDNEGAAIVPGKPTESAMLALIAPDKDGEAEMPKGKKPLHSAEIELIKKWIAEGAKNDTPASAQRKVDAEHPPVYTLPPVITSLDYSPDGTLLAVAGFHEVLLHKADGSGLVARLIGLSERIESVRFSPDGKFLAVTGGNPARRGEVQVWDVAKRKLALSHSTTFDTIYGASWSPDGKAIAFGCADNTVRAINAKTGEQIFYQGAHNDWVLGTVFDVKGEHLISAGRDMTSKLTVFKSSRFVDNITSITPKALKGGIASIARHPTREHILVGGADGAPQIYRIFRQTKRVIGDNANLIRKFPDMPGRIFSVRYSKDGNVFAAGSALDGHGQVAMYSANSPADIKAIQVDIPASGIYALAFSPDGKTLAAAGSDGHIRFLNAADGKELKKFVPVTLSKPAANAAVATAGGMNTTETIAESLPEGAKVSSLSIEPTNISLTGASDYTQVLVTAHFTNGTRGDVTRIAKLTLTGAVATANARGQVTPAKDGAGQFIAELGGQKTSAKISVNGIGSKREIDYVRDVMPVLSKLGCNAGTCHGAKDGKNGFKLSLRGYDPLYDVRAFTDEHASRRVNIASPADSLMLLKSTATVPHEGGQVTKPGDKYYNILHEWIATGAKLNLKSARVASIELSPQKPVIQNIGGRQQMRVLATYTNGEKRDVTAEAFISSSNQDVTDADKGGLVTVLRRGEAAVLARFEGAYAATTVTAMGDRSGFVWKQPETWSDIDKLTAAKWQRLKIAPSGLCSDADFLRRVYLDLTGLPPSAEVVGKFLADKRDTRAKRAELVDALVGSEPYIDHWANKWADLLQVNRKFLGAAGAKSFRDWIRNEVKTNTPYDDFARKILTASGSNKTNPAASYYKILRKPDAIMENTTHLWLATRFNCNKCHDHPFERWTQDQYYETAAFFAQVGLKKDAKASGNKTVGGTAVEGKKPLFEEIFDKPNGDMKHDRTGAITAPKFPFVAKYAKQEKATRRQELAAWITSPDNRYFARSYVNRLWGYLLGVGIIEPLDDIRAGNPASNPELLDWLTAEFIKSKFNVQHIVKLICKSRTYQLTIATNPWNEDDTINYSHAIARRLPAEVLYDTIYFATGTQSKFPGVPAGTRAAALPDSGVKLADGFLGNLGRPPRESACECERATGLQLGPVMALITGPTVDTAITDPKNAITRLVKETKDDRKLIDALFMRILNRHATEKEIKSCLAVIVQEIDLDHATLGNDLHEAQKDVKPELDAKEKARADAIAKAEGIITAYQKETAVALKKATDARNARIKKATDATQAFDKAMPAKLAAWEKDLKDGKSIWTILNPRELTSDITGAKLETLEDQSIFASGKNGKGKYIIKSAIDLANLTGLRIEALTDKRLPKSGPGRGGGNFVLSELEATVGPLRDLNHWKLAKEWHFAKPAKDWIAANGASLSQSDGALRMTSTAKSGSLTFGELHHAGPFVNVGFDQKAGPEGLDSFDAKQQFTHGAAKIGWARKPEWKDGQLFATVFSAPNSANYLHKIITADAPRDLPLSLGSDDGIKVFLNGKQVHANNIGRAAAADQEKITVKLRKGANHLLLKIHNQGGVSGFYLKANAKAKLEPSIAATASAAKGSIAVEIVAKASASRKAQLFWKTKKQKTFDAKRSTAPITLAKSDEWQTIRFDFVTTDDLTGIQFQPGGELDIKSIKLYRAGAPVKLAFQNAQATFAQGSYAAATAVDGKVPAANNGWAIFPQISKPQAASFETKQDVQFKGGAELTVTLNQQFQDGTHTLGRFRLAVTDAPRPVTYGVPQPVKTIFAVAADKRTAAQKKQLSAAYKKANPIHIALAKALATARVPLPVDPKLTALKTKLTAAQMPVPIPARIAHLRRAMELSKTHLGNKRLIGAQDIAWALINSPAFLFNH